MIYHSAICPSVCVTLAEIEATEPLTTAYCENTVEMFVCTGVSRFFNLWYRIDSSIITCAK